jgi:tol-pal system protein YbgF
LKLAHHFFFLWCGIILMGCATPAVQSDLSLLDKKIARQKREVQEVRQKQADLDSRLDALQSDFQRMRGAVEESGHYAQRASDDVIALREDLTARIKQQEEDLNQIREDMTTVKMRLGIGVGTSQPDKGFPPPQPGGTQLTTIPPTGDLVKVTGVPDPEELYNSAYSKLTQGDLQGARKEFKKFLELFPQTEYSDNAQFWIGESYYREKKYEEAILEFEEVIKKFPQGNKVPDALLKQAFSFIALNDTNSAKLLLQKIIDQYPATAQAEIARVKLGTLK